MDNQTSICKNCGHSFYEKFCNHCGQPALERFSISYLWSLLKQDLFEVDRGLWRTVKDLTIRPGYMVRDFLNGRTKTYFSPLKYLLVAIALFYLTISLESFLTDSDTSNTFSHWKNEYFFNDHPAFSIETMNDLVSSLPLILSEGLTIYFLLLMPFLALSSVLVFKRYNFTEYLITYTFLWGHSVMIMTIVSLLTSVITILIPSAEALLVILIVLSFILVIVFWNLLFKQLLELSWGKIILKSILAFYSGLISFYGLVILSLMILKAILLNT